jgi:uncharacterized protein YdhG (YjbR/CyaY superfamily)
MKSNAKTPQEYIAELPEDRKEAMQKLRDVVLKNLPEEFEEIMSYGMLGYVVPHSIYPKGYRADPKMPLPLMNIASQKNFIAVYHMGVYANSKLLDWFVNEYPKHMKTKLDMGKGCIRFKNANQIPYQLIGELVGKLTPQKWIENYEMAFVRK